MRARMAILAGVFVGLAHARADVIVYDNSDGQFEFLGSDGQDFFGTHLDIRLPPTQSGEQSSTAFTYEIDFGWTSNSAVGWYFGGFNQVRFTVTEPWTDPNPGAEWWTVDGPALGLSPGDVVDGSYLFDRRADYFYEHRQTHEPTFFLDFPAYLGVNIGDHYGWVLVDQVGPIGSNEGLTSIAALAWAYETEPNTPITIVPAPGPVALLGGGGLIVAGLRRRRS